MAVYEPTEIDTENWSPRDVETKILQLVQLLDRNIAAVKERSDAFLEADHRYQQAYATAYINIEAPTVGQREQMATLQTAEEYYARKAAELGLKSAKDAGHNIRSALNSLENVLRNYGASERHSRGVGR